MLSEPGKTEKPLLSTFNAAQKGEILEVVESKAVAMCKPILDELGVSPEKLKNYKWTSQELIGFAVGQIRYEKEKRRAVVIELRKLVRKSYSGSQEHIDFIGKILEDM
jgi:hypothetical protein